MIVSINRQPVNSTEDITKFSATLKPGDAVQFRVLEQGPQQRLDGPLRWPAPCRPTGGKRGSLLACTKGGRIASGRPFFMSRN